MSGPWQSIFIKTEGRREPRRGAILGSSPSGGWLRVGRGGGCYSASGLGRAQAPGTANGKHGWQLRESVVGLDSRDAKPDNGEWKA